MTGTLLRRALTWRVFDDAGSAALEFVAGAIVLLVPAIYAVLCFAAIESGTLAVESASRHAARLYVDQPDPATASTVARLSATDTMAAYGYMGQAPQIGITCRNTCQGAGGLVTVRVSVRIALPFLPQWPSVRRLTSVSLSSSASQATARLGVVP